MKTRRRLPARGRGTGRSARPRRRGQARLYATTLPGLEGVLAEELVGASAARDVAAGRGTVIFEHQMPLPLPAPLLACDTLSLLVREAQGEFAGAKGLGTLCGKLARTQFERSSDLLSRLRGAAPRTFTVAADVARGCGFMFFDARRRALPVLAQRLGLTPSDDQADLVVDIQCFPDVVRIGVRLPLQTWPRPSAKASDSRPRSLIGSLIRLADPNRAVTLCDPDCGSGEILAAWQSVVGARHVVGLGFRRPSSQLVTAAGRLVQASSRRWPIGDGRLSRIISTLPFVRNPAEFAKLLGETDRCLAPGGSAAFVVPGDTVFDSAVQAQPGLRLEREVRFRSDGQALRIIVLQRGKTRESHRSDLTAADRARATSELGGVKSRRGRGPHRPRRHPNRRRRKPAR